LAVYRRDRRLLIGVLLWTAVDPMPFVPPGPHEAWMTRAVLAERWWLREEDGRTVGLTSSKLERPQPGARSGPSGHCSPRGGAARSGPRSQPR
jgi:hypothetical protein